MSEENKNDKKEEILEEKENNNLNEQQITKENNTKKDGKKGVLISIICLLLVAIVVVSGLIVIKLTGEDEVTKKSTKTDTKEVSNYAMKGNSLDNFDLKFLQVEANNKNVVYSPLSIKYALAMLAAGAEGDTKEQIVKVIGDYKFKKYSNSANLSLANAMFVNNNTFKNSVKQRYIDTLKDKYNAEVINDDFRSANTINNWVSDKTFKLVDQLLNDDEVSELDYALVNALAIDMEWVKRIQAEADTFKDVYSVHYIHEKYTESIGFLSDENSYGQLPFNDGEMTAKAVEIGASINNYDIVKELGKDKMTDEITKEYKQFLDEHESDIEQCNYETDVNKYVDKFMSEVGSNYGTSKTSTDYYIYDNDEVKAWAKDLKTYDGVTLQYVSILPKKDTLSEMIKNVNADKLNEIITNLKEIKNENFEQGTITKITGLIPVFSFDYQLSLIDDLKTVGIKDIFDADKANLKGISDAGSVVVDAKHKANIEFSNRGIKAAAVTVFGGAGAAGCIQFDHLYDVPVKVIDMTFDKPYLFIIRDKDTGEVWFMGSVYQPTEHILG